MTIDEVVQILNASQLGGLSHLQEFVLRSAWEGKTYTCMATEAYYGPEHLRKIGSELWSWLSDFWGEPISKSNFRVTLEPRLLSRVHQELIEQHRRRQSPAPFLELPSGPVPLDSSFYIERPPIEELAYAEIQEPGSVIRIKAPRQMGKSSLMLRILDRANTIGYRHVSLDFQQGDSTVFTSLDKFLRWFCANVTRELHLESRLDDFWDEEIGSKVSCTLYFQAYVLQEIETPFVLALNKVNRIFEYPEIAADFLPLLRFWHEQAKQIEIWQKLRLVVAYSTEIYISLNLHQSPFNIGLPLQLPPFDLQQVEDLAVRHGLHGIEGKKAKRLLAMVGGHPYLIRLAFYHLCREDVTLEELFQYSTSESGIYRDHLRGLLEAIQTDPELTAALKQVIAVPEGVRLEPIRAYTLNSMGLVNLEGNEVKLTSELYRRYFSERLGTETLSQSLIEKLEKEKQALAELVNVDSLTEIANRRYFERFLEQEWRRLGSAQQPLSLILCDIDLFKLYNEAYGSKAGDNCLIKIARTLRNCVQHTEHLLAQYGGDEFAVFLPQIESAEAVFLADRIRKNVAALEIAHDPELIIGFSPFITLSIGVATIMTDSNGDLESFIRAAEEALHRSKHWGRDRITVC